MVRWFTGGYTHYLPKGVDAGSKPQAQINVKQPCHGHVQVVFLVSPCASPPPHTQQASESLDGTAWPRPPDSSTSPEHRLRALRGTAHREVQPERPGNAGRPAGLAPCLVAEDPILRPVGPVRSPCGPSQLPQLRGEGRIRSELAGLAGESASCSAAVRSRRKRSVEANGAVRGGSSLVDAMRRFEEVSKIERLCKSRTSWTCWTVCWTVKGG